jgi:hypothetical protein
MVSGSSRLGTAIAREVGRSVLYWLGALTGLFVVLWPAVSLGFEITAWLGGHGPTVDTVIMLVLAGGALALPLVGLAARRFDQLLADTDADSPSAALRAVKLSGNRTRRSNGRRAPRS